MMPLENQIKYVVEVFLLNLSLEHIPGFYSFLVEEGIDSISFFPDALFKGIENIVTSEKTKMKK